MQTELPKGNKNFSIGRTFRAFKYSFQGLRYAYTHEQSMALHIVSTIMVVSAGIFFEIDRYEWFFVLILIGLIVGIELLNTSIEAVVDLITDKVHPLAKIAKDTASAAVLILSLTAFIGGCIIFIPHIVELII